MNKRFSTLLATALVAGGLSSSALATDVTATRDIVTVDGTAFPKDSYFHLLTSTTLGDGALSITKTYDGKADSLFIRTAATNGTIGTAGIDSALWAIDSVPALPIGYAYSFKNKVSGQSIALDLANETISLAAEGTTFGWGGTIGGTLKVVSGDKTYYLDGDAANLQNTETTALKLTPYVPARVALSANDLNEANGTYFQLAIAETVGENVFTNPNYKLEATSVSGSDNNATASAVWLRVKGAEGLKVGNTKAKNDTLFIVVDTVKYDIAGATFDEHSGFKFALDTVKAGTNATNGSSIKDKGMIEPAGNRYAEAYQFTFYRNPGSALADSLIIVTNVPKDGTGTNGSKFEKGDLSYVALANFSASGSGSVLSTSGDANLKLPLLSFKTGTKANVAEGAYFVTVVKSSTKDNNGKDAICDIKGTLSYVKDAKSDLMPSTQWSVKKDGMGKYTFTNRDQVSTSAQYGSSSYLYTYGDNYIFGQDTIKLTQVQTTSKTVGYFNYTDEELATKAIALQFISPIGASAYINIKKDSTLYAAEMEETEAAKFKLVKAAEEKFGPDKLTRASYFLIEQFGDKRALGLEGAAANDVKGTESAAQFKMVMGEDANTSSAHYADTIAVVLRATAKAGEYQIIAATKGSKGTKGEDTYAASYSTNETQGTITGSTGLMQTVALDAATLGTFKVITPAAPEYLNIVEGKPLHQRLYSSANNTLAISMNDEGEAVLKAVSELKAAFEADDFKMFVDTASMADATKPLFFIRTTAGIAAAQKEAGISNYMSVATDNKLNYVPAGKFGAANDTILYYDAKDFTKAPDSVKVVKSKSVFAFRATPTEGEFLIEAVSTGKWCSLSGTCRKCFVILY